MKNKDNVAVIVQARANSQRIKNKMTKEFADGESLWKIACEKLLSLSDLSYTCYLSVCPEDIELYNIAKSFSKDYKWSTINLFERGHEGANVDTGLDKIYEFWNKIPQEYCVLINPCLPFLSVKTIKRFVDTYIKSEHEGLFGVMEKKDYFWNTDGIMTTPWPEGMDILNTKAVDMTYQAAHALYGTKLSLVGAGKWMGSFQKKNDPALFVMKEEECLDIDYQWQFDAYSQLYKSDWRP